MPKSAPFDNHAEQYDSWFDEHAAAYVSELLALRPFVPTEGRGLEIGVGSGRFAKPLGVQLGVDPSPAMRAIAFARGLDVVAGTAEELPFATAGFDYVLIVTTICFVDSPSRMLAEARRVLKPGGRLVLGFIDRESVIGRDYEAHRTESVFYREATFYSAEEVGALLHEAGFTVRDWAQTLRHALSETREIEPLQTGYGRCAFVVVSALSQE
jgi:SAM-dependent methyltransferase